MTTLPATTLPATTLPATTLPATTLTVTTPPAGSVPTGSAADADARIALGWAGPVDHGIPRLGRQIADAATNLGFNGFVAPRSDPADLVDLVDRLPPTIRLLHLQLNDWLFADAGVDAEAAVAALSRRLTSRRTRLTMTLHDLPQLSDGRELYRRRRNTYSSMVRCAAGIVVSSDHERVLLREALAQSRNLRNPAGSSSPDIPIHVIALPVDLLPVDLLPGDQSPTGRAPHGGVADGDRTVGIFGYLYPGKGHREVLDDLAGMDPAPTVLAIGRASDRHADLPEELSAVAAGTGMSFRCTGYVADEQLADQLRGVDVPVAPHTHISASGSINSWISAGRRPLVPAGRYVTELERRMPGSVWIYQPGELRRKVEWAFAHPEVTWLGPRVVVGPTTQLVAAGYLDWLRLQVAWVST